MTRLTARLVTLALLLAATALPASAQRVLRTERVRFAPGAYSATYMNEARAGRPVRYLVSAGAGQTLTASTDDPTGATNCFVQVFAPGRPIRDSNAAPNADGIRYSVPEWSGRLSRSGAYQVLVINAQRGPGCAVAISVY